MIMADTRKYREAGIVQLAWRTGEIAATGIDDDPDSSVAPSYQDDELSIIDRARTDPRAFAPVYQHYAPIVHAYCLRRLSDPEAAADATSQIFTKALTGLQRFTPNRARAGSTFRSWLFTIAHNVVIDTRRRHRGHLSLDFDHQTARLAGSPHLIDRAASPEELAIRADEACRVRLMLEQLPDRQRQIVELRLTGVEIARALSMSESAVKSAQFRAYTTLRGLLNAEDPDRTGETR